MTVPYSIGAMAKAAGVPTTTVRYYERRGLLTPDGRSRAKYRVYGEASLERLRFIRSAQATGFTLEDIAALLTLLDEGAGERCRSEVSAMLAGRLADVEMRLADLTRVREVLREAAATCRASNGPCPVLAKLTVKKSANRA
ncbi:MAG: heavy metal-responsive transcriptional regulator [Phycisphaeraceae bacterium]|nr:MAG: heavy metal-responsive transcriptional regulator [Phycisphaeraceae bacterium]